MTLYHILENNATTPLDSQESALQRSKTGLSYLVLMSCHAVMPFPYRSLYRLSCAGKSNCFYAIPDQLSSLDLKHGAQSIATPTTQVKKYISKILIFWNLQNLYFLNCEILLCFV